MILLLSNSAFARQYPSIKQIDKWHYVCTIKLDAVIFVDASENNKIRKREPSCYFFKKSKEKCELLKSVYFGDANDMKYFINDINGDSINELITIDMDEAYYNATIFEIKTIKGKIQIKEAYSINNLYLPQNGSKNYTNKLCEFRQDTTRKTYLVLFANENDFETQSISIVFDNKERKYITNYQNTP